MITNKGKITFTIPSCIANGEFIYGLGWVQISNNLITKATTSSGLKRKFYRSFRVLLRVLTDIFPIQSRKKIDHTYIYYGLVTYISFPGTPRC
jgi:hypothetical protein